MVEVQPAATRVASVMEDPQVDSIARVYADALLDAIPDDQQTAVIDELDSFVQDVLPRFPAFQQLLASAIVGREEKLGMIENVLASRGSQTFTSFMKVLARHDRLDLLPAICRQVGLQFELRSGRKRVQVTTAVPISEETRRAIEQSLAQSLSFAPIVEASVDPALIGGMRIRVGDTVYDGSLRARLKQLQQRVQQRSTHEIQSGRDRFSHPERD